MRRVGEKVKREKVDNVIHGLIEIWNERNEN